MKPCSILKLLVVAGGLVFFNPARGQTSPSDSLTALLDQTSVPEKRVDLLCAIARDHVDRNDTTAGTFVSQASELATKIKYGNGVKYALTLQGLISFNNGDYQKALNEFRLSKKIISDQRPELEAYNLMLIGCIYRDWARYDSAEIYYRKAIQRAGENADPAYLGLFYYNLARLKGVLWYNDEAMELLTKAEAFALKKPGDYYLLMDIWGFYGAMYWRMLDYPKADGYYTKACEQEKHHQNFRQRINCSLYESDILVRNGELAKGLNETFKALQISDIRKYPRQRVEVYVKIGTIYEEFSQLSLASQYYYEGLKIAERYQLRYEKADLLSRLAWVYKEERDFGKALEYLDKSEGIRKEMGDRYGIADCENIRGLIYLLQKQYDKSIAEFDKSMAIRRMLGNEVFLGATIYNLALVYEAIGKNDLALQYQLETLATDEKRKNLLGMAISYNGISQLLTKMKHYSEAEMYLKKATSLSYLLGSKILRRNVMANYATLAEAEGDYLRSVQYHKKASSLTDSIYAENSQVKLAEMQALYQIEKQENEIRTLDMLRKQQEEELASQRALASQQRYIIAVTSLAIVLMLVAGAFAFRFIKVKSKANRDLQKLNAAVIEQKEEIQAQSEELVEASETIAGINKELENKIEARTSELKQAYKELDTFFYRSSHDFRRPITTFLGLAGVAKITVKDPVSLELFEKVSETASGLDRMLHKLQSISDVGSQQMVFREVSLNLIAEEIMESLETQIKAKKIVVQTSIHDKTSLISYPAMVKIIIENLVENAVQFSAMENPHIHVTARSANNVTIVEVEDNGHGIREEYVPRLFEMYFRASEYSKGNGLGLYIAKKAVEKLNGTIRFRTVYGEGSTFTVAIPNQKG